MQTSRTNNKGDISTFKVRYVDYFGTPWMTLNYELQVQMSARMERTYIFVIHITYEDIQPSTYEKQPVEKCR